MSNNTKPDRLPIIDQFLAANLLGDLGEDSTRYEYLVKTVVDLETQLSKKMSNLIPFSLVAFQPAPDPSEPQLESIYQTLRVHWKLIDNKYSTERPVMLLRAIALQVVERLCSDKLRYSAVIAHSNIAAFAHYKYPPSEHDICHKILADATHRADQFGKEGWVRYSNSSQNTKMEFVEPTVSVDDAKLLDGLVAAVGPTGEKGTPKADPNPYWVTNDMQNWSYQFAPRAQKAVSAAIQSAVKAAFIEFTAGANTSVSTAILESIKAGRSTVDSSARQIEVLWWMQSQFSPSLAKTYRELEPFPAAVAAAHDLFGLTGARVPESVVHVLGEAILEGARWKSDGSNQDQTVLEILSSIGRSVPLLALKPHLGKPAASLGSVPLLALLRGFLSTQEPSAAGLATWSSIRLSPRQLGMWLYREMVAEKLLTEA